MAKDYMIAPEAIFEVTWRRTHDECMTFTGRYKGLSAMASETALVFDVDGIIRFISASAIVCMDQVEAAPDASQTVKKSDSDNVFYG